MELVSKRTDGVMFPAHIDKASNSLIYNLGFIPEDSLFRTAEIADMKQYHALKKAIPIWSIAGLSAIRTPIIWRTFMNRGCQ